ncbi:glycoside hydrolase family 99-like domain-containing protein [Chryseobacterium sp.]|uniref:glycosyltransferase WbsX family protein n=1 Tax=Chryseobacterium sp. TaxID=1871047 RepID=UPI002898D4C2|nr:glycoside hydrolase family 99-like domain-containing protein [Chryseobacterium sp.]
MKIRPIAIHLPQYHPFPENDEWWGKGFTEWTNVTKAKPLFENHYQPHLPSDLGFYDLRLEEARMAQELLAKQYGIYGFCYYHYWFNGKRLMHEPIDRKLKNPKEDLPFMLCWANENWTRRWDGNEHEVLIEQKYSVQDDEDHIDFLLPIFKDPRYIKVNNKPVIVIYKPNVFPNIQETLKCWRERAKEAGLELYICHMVFSYQKDWDQLVDGFDAAVDFEPFGVRRKSVFKEMWERRVPPKRTIIDKIKGRIIKQPVKKRFNSVPYKWMGENLILQKDFQCKLYPSLVPGWDNTSRRGENPTLILEDSTPEYFEHWLSNVKADFTPYSEDENFIFINAWNEWAEGNHLEPDMKFGTQYLESVKKIFSDQL